MDINKILNKIELKKEDIVQLLSLTDEENIRKLHNKGVEVRQNLVGDDVYLRGIIEFSNNCRLDCIYCGLRLSNDNVERYRMNIDEIINVAGEINRLGIKTIVLQSGEDMFFSGSDIEKIILKIKEKYDVAITLSLGERSHEEYLMWKEAGADRYLLKHETANRGIYKQIHPTQDFDEKINNLKFLKSIGYQVGSGNIVGLPGQTVEDIADDLILCNELNVDMASFSPFMPAANTPLENEPTGDLTLLLNTMAVARIFLKHVHIPSTTALSTLLPEGRRLGLETGANVVMPNFTPLLHRGNYLIYNGKNKSRLEAEENLKNVIEELENIGMNPSFKKGHSMKLEKN